MRLPEELVAAIQSEVQKADPRELLPAAEELTRRYKAGGYGARAIQNDAQRAAYLLVRLPATYAAISRVFSEIRRLAPQSDVASLLDLGAGPGTSLFAATEVFSALHEAQLIEMSHDWLELGQRLAASIRPSGLPQPQWIERDLLRQPELLPHDLVVASYSIGELPESQAQALVRRAWRCAGKFMVVIEPGTPRGFATVHAARSTFIAEGAFILAPCPHCDACPMIGTRDWCHFAQRVERTSQHRRLKGGSLGHEDEKFSYVVASKTSVRAPAARIVRHPNKLSGHVQLSLCTERGIEPQTITRSQREAYRVARQAEWGDVWDNASRHEA